MRRFELLFRLLNIALDLSGALDDGLLRRPDFFKVGKLPLYKVYLLIQQLNLFSRCLCGVFFYRLSLNFELNKTSF